MRPMIEQRRSLSLRAAIAALWSLLLLCLAVPAQAQTFPELAGKPVVDAANIIPDDQESALDQKLLDYEKTNGHQLAVVTVPDLQGYDIADYGYRLGRKWGLGDAKADDGILLIVAPNDRKVRIEVGYGLEPILTDAFSSVIINAAIVPRFKAGDMPGGISAGVDEIIKQTSLPPDEAAARAKQVSAKANRGSGDGGMAIFWIFIFLFFVLPILLSMMRGKKGRRYQRGGMGPVIIWGPGFGGGGGGWDGGGFGGGGFGGGGFSGGGGGFGGGGASGGW